MWLRTALLATAPGWLVQAGAHRYYRSRLAHHVLPEHRVLRALIHEGDTVLDVGAHIGWYSKTLSELVGPRGRVIAAEPVPATFASLAFNVRALHLGNVQPVMMAVSDEPGTAVMEIPRYPAVPGTRHPGEANSYEARIVADGNAAGLRRFEVTRTTIDALAGGLPVSFIKMDIEGHELAATRGGVLTIGRNHPALLVELLRNPDHHPPSDERQLVDLLAASGYEAFWWDGQRLRFRRRPPQHPSSDYFFLRAEHLEPLRAAGLEPLIDPDAH